MQGYGSGYQVYGPEYGREQQYGAPYPTAYYRAPYPAQVAQPHNSNAVPFPMARPKNSAVIPPHPGHARSSSYNHPPSQHRPRHESNEGRNVNAVPVVPKPPKPKHGKPLKSAMKKNQRPVTPTELNPMAEPSLSRARTISDPARFRTTSFSRPSSRQGSKHHTPHILMVSFHGQNKIKLESVTYQSTVAEVHEKVPPMWPPGVDSFTYVPERNEITIQFHGRPWAEKGSLGVMGMKLVLQLWSVLGNNFQNPAMDMIYACESTIHSIDANEPPRIVFGLCARLTPTTSYWMICLSEKRRKLKLIGAPQHIETRLVEHLKYAFPHQLASAGLRSDESYRIEMKSAGFDQVADFWVAQILQFVTGNGYKLDAGIPLPQQSMFGLSGRKEVWIFSSVPSTNS